jgi:F0F1-type ATP synthase membrane subunit b/b'
MEHIDPLMGVILPYANFFIFLGLAIYFFRKPAREGAAKKRTEFLRVMNEAKKSYDDANEKLNQLKKRQANLESEIADLKKTSELAAKTEADRIISDSERLANHLREEAKRIAAAELTKAKSELRQEIVSAVSSNVTHKISKEVTKDKHLEIVRRNISELKTIKVEG